MSDYDITRAKGLCCVSGKSFDEGEEFYTVVVDSGGALERRDYSLDAWTGPPDGTVCHFRTRMPRKNAPPKMFVSDDMIIGFFRDLAETADARKLRFRFVLALMLLRKRLLKYEGTRRGPAGEFWQMRLTRDKSLHEVFNPDLQESEIESLSGELSVVLQSHAIEAMAERGSAPDVDTADSNDESPADCAAGVAAERSVET
jgi:hypothetical protein